MQQELASRGYYTDAIDGIVGPKTIAALEAFQRDAGLRVSPHFYTGASELAEFAEALSELRAQGSWKTFVGSTKAY